MKKIKYIKFNSKAEARSYALSMLKNIEINVIAHENMINKYEEDMKNAKNDRHKKAINKMFLKKEAFYNSYDSMFYNNYYYTMNSLFAKEDIDTMMSKFPDGFIDKNFVRAMFKLYKPNLNNTFMAWDI